jgi:hypothetical protein
VIVVYFGLAIFFNIRSGQSLLEQFTGWIFDSIVALAILFIITGAVPRKRNMPAYREKQARVD